jgi:hypothetical protein
VVTSWAVLTENPKIIPALDIQRRRRGRLHIGGHFVEGLIARLVAVRSLRMGAEAEERVVRDGQIKRRTWGALRSPSGEEDKQAILNRSVGNLAMIEICEVGEKGRECNRAGI